MSLGQAYLPPQLDHSCQFGTLSPCGDLRPLNEGTDANTDPIAGADFHAEAAAPCAAILSPKVMETGVADDSKGTSADEIYDQEPSQVHLSILIYRMLRLIIWPSRM